MNKNVDLTPTIRFFLSFKRYSYTISTAICEFIDNSIASFEQNKHLLRKNNPDFKLKINIVYDVSPYSLGSKHKLIISDNAFGMNEDRFEHSLSLQNEPENKRYLGEYGIGLKTAASWFGNYWKLESTQLDDLEKYEVIYDLERFDQGISEVEIQNEKIASQKHYTVITISQLNRKINPINLEQLNRYIEMVYQKWINDESIEIRVAREKDSKYEDPIKKLWFDDFFQIEPITPEKKEIYYNPDKGEHFKWKIDDSLNSNGKKYFFKGFFAINKHVIMDNPGPGIYFFRKKRLIDIYYPVSLFGRGNPQRRIFAELEITDNWPVSQTKDKISWEGDMNKLFQDKIDKFLKDNIIKRICQKLGTSETHVSIKPLIKSGNIGKKFKEFFNNNLKNTAELSTQVVSSSSKFEDKHSEAVIAFNTDENSSLKRLKIVWNSNSESKDVFSLNGPYFQKEWMLTIFLKAHFFLCFNKKKLSSNDLNVISKLFSGFVLSLIQLDANQRKTTVNILNNYLQNNV